MNIRPYTDILRAKYGKNTFTRRWDSVGGGVRVVTLYQMFRGSRPLEDSEPVKMADRYVDVQLWDTPQHPMPHRACHMLVTRPGLRNLDGSASFMHGSTYPSYFDWPEQMIFAIFLELTRADHKK